MAVQTKFIHDWQLSPKDAIRLQQQLAKQVRLADDFGTINLVAGVDVGFEDEGRVTRAAVAVLEFPALELEEVAIGRCKTRFPYVPGLLSFRELPAVLKALEKLQSVPDILLCDGQGVAHPRRFGIASHLGLICNLPSIGIGKSRLLGTHAPVPDERGAWQPLYDKSETIGAVLRTRKGVKPIYVSPGHRISLSSAIEYVMACTTRYKLPETTRQAHRFASG